jgi:Tfp pilus assembly protein PilP
MHRAVRFALGLVALLAVAGCIGATDNPDAGSENVEAQNTETPTLPHDLEIEEGETTRVNEQPVRHVWTGTLGPGVGVTEDGPEAPSTSTTFTVPGGVDLAVRADLEVVEASGPEPLGTSQIGLGVVSADGFEHCQAAFFSQPCEIGGPGTLDERSTWTAQVRSEASYQDVEFRVNLTIEALETQATQPRAPERGSRSASPTAASTRTTRSTTARTAPSTRARPSRTSPVRSPC